MRKYAFAFVPSVLMLHCQVFAAVKDPVMKAREERALTVPPLDISSVRLLRGPLKQAELVKSKEKVTVRFEATAGNVIAAVFGIRIIRADAQR